MKTFEHIHSLEELRTYALRHRMRGKHLSRIYIPPTAHREYFRHMNDGLRMMPFNSMISHPNTRYHVDLKMSYNGIPLIVRNSP